MSGTGSRQERKERGVLFLVMFNWSFCSDHLGELLSWCLWSTAELHIKTIKVWMFTVLIFICIFIFYVKFLSDWFWNQRLGADAKKELQDALLCFLDAIPLLHKTLFLSGVYLLFARLFSITIPTTVFWEPIINYRSVHNCLSVSQHCPMCLCQETNSCLSPVWA